MTRTVGCRARGQPLRRLRVIAGTREVSAQGPWLGRAWTPRPSPGPAAAAKMSPAAMRNGDPCRRPGRLSPLPILAIRPPPGHSTPQPSSVGSSWVGDGGCHTLPLPPCSLGGSRVQAMERTPPPNLITVPVWSLHTNQWMLMSRHYYSKGTQAPLTIVSRSLLCRPSMPQSLPVWGC